MQLAAGPELRAACTEIAKEKRKTNSQPCGVGEAVTTSAYNLPAEHLIHVVGPDCRRPTQDQYRRELLKKSMSHYLQKLRI
jgi:O-acetyl-ADP-ribose deacetylase (regulator of RNase III)